MKEHIQEQVFISPASADYNVTKDVSATGFYKAEQLTNNRNRACISVTA